MIQYQINLLTSITATQLCATTFLSTTMTSMTYDYISQLMYVATTGGLYTLSLQSCVLSGPSASGSLSGGIFCKNVGAFFVDTITGVLFNASSGANSLVISFASIQHSVV